MKCRPKIGEKKMYDETRSVCLATGVLIDFSLRSPANKPVYRGVRGYPPPPEIFKVGII